MSLVLINIGHCGNQIGKDFLKKTEKEKAKDHGSPFVHHDKTFRCVVVDSEPKVVVDMKKEFRSSLPDRKLVEGKGSRGCNWALGYHGVNGENLLESSLNAVRLEAEKCDCFSGSIVLHSLTGGTGGGEQTYM